MKMLGRSSVVVVLLVAAVAAHAGAAGAAGAPVAPSAAETLGNQHANLRAAITSANAHSLRAAWLVRTPGPVSSTPIVWRGSLLFSDWRGWAWRVNALTGKVIWKRHLDTPDTTWPWYGLAGTGVVSGNVLVEVSADGYAWGLNAATGKPVWNKTYIGGDPAPNTRNPNDPYAKYVGNLSDLLAAGGRVFVGLSSCEEPFAESNPLFVPTARGSVIALDAATGNVDWQTWLVPTGDTGVPVWSSFALDPASTAQHPSGILYTDTGNNYTNPTTANSDAMLALDARTGELIWTTQLTPGDSWPTAGTDADFGAGPQLFTAAGAGGTVLKLVGAMQKPGLYTALDRATGAIVWQTKLGNTSSRGEASVGQGRLFATANVRLTSGRYRGVIAAVATATGKTLWRRTWSNAFMLADAGFLSHDVYLIGDNAGALRAFRASNGKLLWSANTPGRSSVTSSLWVAGRFLYVGIGLPNHPSHPFGVAAFRLP